MDMNLYVKLHVLTEIKNDIRDAELFEVTHACHLCKVCISHINAM